MKLKISQFAFFVRVVTPLHRSLFRMYVHVHASSNTYIYVDMFFVYELKIATSFFKLTEYLPQLNHRGIWDSAFERARWCFYQPNSELKRQLINYLKSIFFHTSSCIFLPTFHWAKGINKRWTYNLKTEFFSHCIEKIVSGRLEDRTKHKRRSWRISKKEGKCLYAIWKACQVF